MPIPVAETEAIFAAVDANDPERIHELIRHRADIVDAHRPSDGLSLVLYAMYQGKWELVDILAPIHPGLDIFESAALGRASRVKHLTTTNRKLLAKIAPDGWTALHLAAFFGQIDSVRILLEQGAEVDPPSQNAMANHPLHAAAAGRHLMVCDILLTNGADVNAKQHGGWTPLMAAAQHGDRGLCELFLRRGARKGEKSDDGKTAAALAAEHGHEDIARLLA